MPFFMTTPGWSFLEDNDICEVFPTFTLLNTMLDVFFHFIYLWERGEKKGEKELLSADWLSKCLQHLGLGQSHSQQPGTQSRLLMWEAENQFLEPSLLLSGIFIKRSWIRELNLGTLTCYTGLLVTLNTWQPAQRWHFSWCSVDRDQSFRVLLQK